MNQKFFAILKIKIYSHNVFVEFISIVRSEIEAFVTTSFIIDNFKPAIFTSIRIFTKFVTTILEKNEKAKIEKQNKKHEKFQK